MVTEMLEAFFWERMTVAKVSQDYYPAEHDIPDLHLEHGAEILERKIFLRGRMSHENRIYAESIIVPGRLDEKMRDGLLNSEKPIGLLIQEDRLETFREILGCGKEPAAELAPAFRIAEDDYLIYRVYRVLANRSPIMLITEKFPELETL